MRAVCRQCIGSLDNSNAGLLTLAFAATRDCLAAGCSDGAIALWDLRSGSIAQQHYDHEAAVTSLSMHPRSSLIRHMNSQLSHSAFKSVGFYQCLFSADRRQQASTRWVTPLSMQGACLVVQQSGWQLKALGPAPGLPQLHTGRTRGRCAGCCLLSGWRLPGVRRR